MCFIEAIDALQTEEVEPVSAGEDTPEANTTALPRVFHGDQHGGKLPYVVVAFPNGRSVYVYPDGTTGGNNLSGDDLRDKIGLTELTAAPKVTEHTVTTGPTGWPDLSSSVMEERVHAVKNWFESNGWSPMSAVFITTLAENADKALLRFVQEQNNNSYGGVQFLGTPEEVVATILPIVAGRYVGSSINGAAIQPAFEAELERQVKLTQDGPSEHDQEVRQLAEQLTGTDALAELFEALGQIPAEGLSLSV